MATAEMRPAALLLGACATHVVSVEASVTGFKATITAEGNCKLHFDRDPALAPTPVVPAP